MTTIINQPSDGSGNTQGVGAALVEGRLSDLARSVHDPASDLTLPVLNLVDWDQLGDSEDNLRAAVAVQSLLIADATDVHNDRHRAGAARQRGADRAALERLRKLIGPVNAKDPVGSALKAAPGLGALRGDEAGRELDQALTQSARTFRFLQHRFRTGETLNQGVDLRAAWYGIRDQRGSGGCVGFAVGDLLWRQRRQRLDIPSARFIWQAAKEIDGEDRPTTMIAGAGTSVRAALHLVKRYGFALESELPSDRTDLYSGSIDTFYEVIGERRITAFVNLGNDAKTRLAWLSMGRPIACTLRAGRNFIDARGSDAIIAAESTPAEDTFAHAAVMVGYRVGHYDEHGQWVQAGTPISELARAVEKSGSKSYEDFPVQYLLRNSAGASWGDRGYAWVRHVDFFKQITECYGVFCSQDQLDETSRPPR